MDRYPLHGLELRVEVQDGMPWENVGLHQHDFIEVVIVFGGRTRQLGVDGREEEMVPGEVRVLRPGDAHGYRGFRQVRLANLHFSPTWFFREAGDLAVDGRFQALFRAGPRLEGPGRALRLNGANLAEAESLALRLRDELAGEGTGRTTLARSLFWELIVLITRAGADRRAAGPGERASRLGAACAYLEKHYRDSPAIEDLARRAGMSVNTFLRGFRALYGTSPAAYAARLRLAHARKLLRETDWSVTRVAMESGFADGNYLTRRYREEFGEPPGKTRARDGGRARGLG